MDAKSWAGEKHKLFLPRRRVYILSGDLMLLQDRNGICCDFCGLIFKDQFIYYPFDTSKLKIVNNMRVSSINAKFSKDMCEQCYEGLLEDVKTHIGVFKRGHVKCDLSKTYGTGTFDYYILNFHKVDVDKERSENAIVDNQIMDINIIKRFDELVKKTEVIRDKSKQQGGWS